MKRLIEMLDYAANTLHPHKYVWEHNIEFQVELYEELLKADLSIEGVVRNEYLMERHRFEYKVREIGGLVIVRDFGYIEGVYREVGGVPIRGDISLNGLQIVYKNVDVVCADREKFLFFDKVQNENYMTPFVWVHNDNNSPLIKPLLDELYDKSSEMSEKYRAANPL